MINTDENKKEVTRGAGFYNQRPDSNALCESLVSKLTENDDEKPKFNVKSVYHLGRDNSDEMSDTEELEKRDEESDSSSAPASPAPRKTPRAFEKSDYLYEKQKEKEALEESEDWSWEDEEFLQEDHVISKDTNNSYRP
ncbi:unnamed protein product [Euphydryas editha]|uniref:Uncharacterized protein n=1 Tax=Euphydryas editha TaxID=104508 RepID=A0AAU9UVR7_EUPED|nr:unnamed protein product [Euphydryas editha]